MKYQIVTKNVSETRKEAASLARQIGKGKLVCLFGELGSGKTTFAQGMGKELGIKDSINSPTFNILKIYSTKDEETKKLYHVDCYRLEKAKDLEELGFKEWISDEDGIVVVEWADKIKRILPKERIDIRFEIVGEGERKMVVTTNYYHHEKNNHY